MSAVRLLLSLLVCVLVLCACLPAPTVASDPTIACKLPFGDPSLSTSYPSDVGYYNLVGLDYYSSTNYNILCAWRGVYNYGPSGKGTVIGPWHGNPKMDTTDCTGPYASQLNLSPDWVEYGTGSWMTRINNATGRAVVVQFQLSGVCSDNYMCAGAGCPGNPNYATEQATIQADPTIKVTRFGGSSAGTTLPPPTVFQVITMLNSTVTTNTSVAPPSPNQYPTMLLSVITSIQYCYGFVNVTC